MKEVPARGLGIRFDDMQDQPLLVLSRGYNGVPVLDLLLYGGSVSLEVGVLKPMSVNGRVDRASSIRTWHTTT